MIDKAIGSALLMPFSPILDAVGLGDVVQGVGEFGRGVAVGFVKGVASTFEGIYNMVAHPIDTLGGIAKLAGVAVVGYSSPIPGITPEQRLSMFDAKFGTNLSQVNDGIKQSLADTGDTLLHGTNEQRGEIVGQAIEFVAEIAVGTKGAGGALKAAKGGEEAAELAKATKVANAADKAVEAEKLAKLPEATKGIFGKGAHGQPAWQIHENSVTKKLIADNPDAKVGEQITLKVKGVDANGKAFEKTIRIDNLNKTPNRTYQLTDAKYSEAKDLTQVPTNELRNTFTKNQKTVYDAIGGKDGASITEVTPVGQKAIDMGLKPGTPINIEPNVQIGVNDPNGVIKYRKYP